MRYVASFLILTVLCACTTEQKPAPPEYEQKGTPMIEQTSTAVPPIDTKAPQQVQTATFALG